MPAIEINILLYKDSGHRLYGGFQSIISAFKRRWQGGVRRCLDREGGRFVGASLPGSAEDEGKESEGQDDDNHEAAAVRSAAVDAALPLIPEFPFAAHFVRS
jgi:hypothetical protein